MSDPAEILEGTIAAWVDDPESDVVYAEKVEDRWAVRMRQTVRDATTVWWDLGERSVRAEAYVTPPPPNRAEDVYRLCLVRNAGSWRTRFCLDSEGAIVIRSRVAVEDLDAEVLDLVLGEIYEFVEISFAPIVRLGFARSTPATGRETNG